MPSEATLKRTPLYDSHLALGARMVPFAGWEMPVFYTSIVDEHHAVRHSVGLFDVSHMGPLLVSGDGAEGFLNRLLTNDVSKCAVGRAQYTLLCNERGGIRDDLIVYRLEPMRFLLVVNAANVEADLAYLKASVSEDVRVENRQPELAILSLQGPLAAKLVPVPATTLRRFEIGEFDVFGIRCWVARTGYTGEDGFEMLCPARKAAPLWQQLLSAGAPLGIRPCGLGARDTLRLEMCYPLHGQDITPDTTPLEAGLDRFVALDKPDFVGRKSLLRQKDRGLTRKLVAFKMTEKAPPPRPSYLLWANGRCVGEVTSGAPSPSLGIGIGMGYVAADVAREGQPITVEIRGKQFAAVMESKPLWKRQP